MNDRERITRLEIRCEQLQLTVNEAFHWIDILKSDLSDLQDRVGQADRKTENSSVFPNNCEPQTEDCGACEYSRITCRYMECGEPCRFKPKDEPQTERSSK